jgi:exopolyphosphatase/guanosine-5'-triphosphate,3'-diphosphate pyrophosphatase
MANKQRVAIIDLGSNTARLVVMGAHPGYDLREEDEIREVVRLRQGMTPAGLSADAMERAFVTLRLFKRFCDSTGVTVILPTATSAVRDAANRSRFLARVREELGLELRVLSGEEEARYGVIGALNDVALRDGTVVDIGGGSAQVSLVRDRQFVRGFSAPIGALALSDRFVQNDPPTSAEIKAVRREIDAQLDAMPWQEARKGVLVALGGTVRNLARMEAVRRQYPLKTLHGFRLTRASVELSLEQMLVAPLAKRRKISGLRPDRADIIVPGVLVLLAIMERAHAEELTLAVNGLREGLFFEHFWSHLGSPIMPDPRSFGVLNLARVYNYDKKHAAQVRFLAGRIFEQLAPLHGYGAEARELLDAAALLHDIGTIIGYNNHHQHSQTLIINSGLPGFSPREVALISLLARYHRKGQPEAGPFATLLAPGDERLLPTLACILRLAEFFERGRNAAVDDVLVQWNDSTLRLTLVADEFPAVELWQAQRNAVELVEAVFARQVMLDSTAAPEHPFTADGDGAQQLGFETLQGEPATALFPTGLD